MRNLSIRSLFSGQRLRNAVALVLALALCVSFAPSLSQPKQAYAAAKPAKVVVLKASTPSNGKMTVKLKKAKGASGYQVKVGIAKKFPSKTTRSATTKKLTVTIKGLKSANTYYVKARAYKVKKGKKTYGPWSSVKTLSISVAKPSQITAPDTKFKGYTFTQVTPQDIPVTYQEIQMRTDAMKASGYYGDHSQWITGLEFSDDGKLVLTGTDCCGAYRSTDHGVTWEQANTGFMSRSTCSFAIDPNNSNHALVTAGNRSGDGASFAGIYQTFDAVDGNCEWTQVEGSHKYLKIFGNRFDWDCFEFDPSTYSASKKITTDVYLSTPYLRDSDVRADAGTKAKVAGSNGMYEPGSDKDKADTSVDSDSAPTKPYPGLYKSTDGGTSFVRLSRDPKLADGIIKFTASGDMYVANMYGLFRVNKQTGAIEKTFFSNADISGTTVALNYNNAPYTVSNFNRGVTGFDVVGNKLFVQTWDAIYTYDGGGEGAAPATRPAADSEFQTLPYPKAPAPHKSFSDKMNPLKVWPQFLTVSPSNPDNMVMMTRRTLKSYYYNYMYCTTDGGKSWNVSTWDQDTIFTEPEGWNAIERMMAYDPTQESTVVANGNGVITRSTDGGANFVQTNGISNLMSGGKICLNYYDPQVITLGAQDFAGAISTNGGDTWRQLHGGKQNNNIIDPDTGVLNTVDTVSDTTRSFYGAFSPDGETIIGFGRNKYGLPFSLMTTATGGSPWTDTMLGTKVGESNSHATTVLQSYNDPNVILANEYRSTDRGRTWTKMAGCRSAYTINYTGRHEIYGGNYKGQPVVSYDEGATWQVLYDGSDGKTLSTYWAAVPGSESIDDIAYDHVNNVLYLLVRFSNQYSAGGSITSGATRVVKFPVGNPSGRKILEGLQYGVGYGNIRSIAVDPNSTSVLYVAAVANCCVNPTGLYRSIDGGETFTNLTYCEGVFKEGTKYEVTVTNKALNQGGYEPDQVRVDPLTGRVYIGTNCYGFEVINPPYDSSQLRHSAPASHVIKYVCDGKVVNQETVKNGHLYKGGYTYAPAGKAFLGWYTDEACTKPFSPGTVMLDSQVVYAMVK